MKNFHVYVETVSTEIYSVEAETEEQARERWSDGRLRHSEAQDSRVTGIEEA